MNKQEYLYDEQIAKLLGISLGRLRNKISSGCPLPPRVVFPESKQRLWPKEKFDEWALKFLIES